MLGMCRVGFAESFVGQKKKCSKTIFSKVVLGPFEMFKQVSVACFEPVVTCFDPQISQTSS